mmetsp:Transcript_31873/g.64530  ORF Transcript_31873/g.64530 Transcript_31873/m.64530 type:complete len:213 (-) Transcript_31873:1295-1933(-)
MVSSSPDVESRDDLILFTTAINSEYNSLPQLLCKVENRRHVSCIQRSFSRTEPGSKSDFFIPSQHDWNRLVTSSSKLLREALMILSRELTPIPCFSVTYFIISRNRAYDAISPRSSSKSMLFDSAIFAAFFPPELNTTKISSKIFSLLKDACSKSGICFCSEKSPIVYKIKYLSTKRASSSSRNSWIVDSSVWEIMFIVSSKSVKMLLHRSV